VLTEDPNDFAARVVADKPLNSRDVCNYAAQRGGADVSAKMPVNKPSELLVVIPALAAGEYKLEVTTQFSATNGKLLKEPRTGVFERILTVI
jgi:hypothetical protein